MFWKAKLLRMLTVFFIISVTVQCSYVNIKSAKSNESFLSTYDHLKPGDFQKEVDKLQAEIRGSRDPQFLANAHLRLALLHSHYRNPVPDYYRALSELEVFASMSSDASNRTYIQNWLRMLKEIARTDSANQDLKDKAEQLKKEFSRMEKENIEMREKLDKLKHLDIELEEKRKMVK